MLQNVPKYDKKILMANFYFLFDQQSMHRISRGRPTLINLLWKCILNNSRWRRRRRQRVFFQCNVNIFQSFEKSFFFFISLQTFFWTKTEFYQLLLLLNSDYVLLTSINLEIFLFVKWVLYLRIVLQNVPLLYTLTVLYT